VTLCGLIVVNFTEENTVCVFKVAKHVTRGHDADILRAGQMETVVLPAGEGEIIRGEKSEKMSTHPLSRN